MKPEPAPYQPHCMTQKPCTSATGSRPSSRQAAKSGTVRPDEKAEESKRRVAASGRSVASPVVAPSLMTQHRPPRLLLAVARHQLSSEMMVIGLGSVTSPVVLVTAVPIARNSMVCEPHWWDSSCMRVMANSRASYNAWVKLGSSVFWPTELSAWVSLRWAMWYTQVPITRPWGTYPVCISVQKSCPERSDVNGLSKAFLYDLPSSALTAVPKAMNSAESL